MELSCIVSVSQDLWPCYGSIATHGNNAATHTWNSAKEEATNHHWITDDNRQDIKDHFSSYGAWDKLKIDSWSDQELTALLIQDICGSLQDIGISLRCD